MHAGKLESLPEAAVSGTPCAASPMKQSMVLLFAVACGLSVANVYYAQPLLDLLARDFNVSRASIGGVITATQAGCALALVLLVPLGDRANRHRLMAVQLVLLAIALVSVATARTAPLLLVGMLATGLLGTAMTQGLIAYAATVAVPQERGRVVGAAQGGVVIGLLLARTMSGLIADVAGWRAVYFTSAALAVVMLPVLWRTLPAQPAPQVRIPYLRLLESMFSLLAHDRVLQIRGTIGMLMFAAFSVFWSAMALPLSAPPFALPHTAIGAFGLAGAAGALAAARAGYWADRGKGEWTTGVAWIVLLLSWLPAVFLSSGLWTLVIGVLLLDLSGQAIHVVNQSMIFRTRPDAHSRLVGCYMLFYATGSGAGALASTHVYAWAGWTGVCVLGATITLAGLLFWAITLRAMPRHDA